MDYQSVIDTLVGFMGVSCPLVIACGRLFNAFVGMVTGKERVRF